MTPSTLLPAAHLAVRTPEDLLPSEQPPLEDRFALLPARSQRALRRALLSQERSYHVFVSAHPDVSFEPDVLAQAARVAKDLPSPGDVAYIHDFDAPNDPRPLLLPPGRGPELEAALSKLLRSLRRKLPSVQRTPDFRARERTLARTLEQKNRAEIHQLDAQAKTLGFGVREIQGGVQTFPILHGKPVSNEQFSVLDEATRKALTEAEEKLSEAVEAAAARIRGLTEEIDDARNEALQREAERLVNAELRPVLESFADVPDAVSFLERLRDELVLSCGDVFDDGKTPEAAALRARGLGINVLLSQPQGESGPSVLFLRNPTAQELFGFIERRVEGGILVSDHDSLRPGALLEASGGFLVLRADDVLRDPILWQKLKKSLFMGESSFETDASALSPLFTSTKPRPAPHATRVILVGDDDIYATLVAQDPDFPQLFRIKVEVPVDVPRSDEALTLLDRYLTTAAEARGLLPFSRPARARLLDLATRVAGDRERLSLVLLPLEETMTFASEEAREQGADVVEAPHVDLAWQERIDRISSASLAARDAVLTGELHIETSGTRVGVINGLAVVSFGDVHFGQPMRITAVVSPGTEGVIDVEREAHLGGSIHTKGVAILRGLLCSLFGQERPLSLRAQITFEQSYGEVDGDSASSAELFSILSALSDVGIAQGIAVTGSVSQLGEMQAIGGVCAKIEGFFDLCAARGLTGQQGVLVPSANVRHLVLRDDVAQAVEEGRFHIHAVADIAQGIELLTGVPAGKRDEAGRFPADSIFGRVERRLIELAERLRSEVTVRDDAQGDDDDSAAAAGLQRR